MQASDGKHSPILFSVLTLLSPEHILFALIAVFCAFHKTTLLWDKWVSMQSQKHEQILDIIGRINIAFISGFEKLKMYIQYKITPDGRGNKTRKEPF